MSLPDELWTEVLDYLDPIDIVSTQRVSSRLLKVARDPGLWRYKCFEKAPSAARAHADRPNALSMLTGALGGLSLNGAAAEPAKYQIQRSAESIRASRRANAVAEWDCSDPNETVDWYSEYVGRHAPLSMAWPETRSQVSNKAKGMALFGHAEKVISPMIDGALCVWSLSRATNGRPRLAEIGRSKPDLLFKDLNSSAASSSKQAPSFGSAVDKIAVDTKRRRAYIAVGAFINEVDLEKMQLISQSKCAWNITALSQANSDQPDQEFALSYGTPWSLHIHDPRVPLGAASTSTDARDSTTSVDRLESKDSNSIAFLHNYNKVQSMREELSETELERMNGTSALAFGSTTPDYSGMSLRGDLRPYAQVEPGPQSILHRREHEIIIAGRMPSILFYDRRSFPNIQSAIHSGGRLSSMTLLPFPPAGAASSIASANSVSDTLIACGEYRGCGSLELYELPRNGISKQTNLYSYRNRQEASASKLLSVAVQGTRIVFSDADGQLKWVERNGRGLARRWNINPYAISDNCASLVDDQVARKMIALPPYFTERSSSSSSTSSSQDSFNTTDVAKGDGDLLIWTGSQIGVVTTKPRMWEDVAHDELVAAFEQKMHLDADAQTAASRQEEYTRQMRRALERQADERRWMGLFSRKLRF